MPYAHPIIAHMDGRGRVFCPSCFEDFELVSERDFEQTSDIADQPNCEGCHRPFPLKTEKVHVGWTGPIPVLKW